MLLNNHLSRVPILDSGDTGSSSTHIASRGRFRRQKYDGREENFEKKTAWSTVAPPTINIYTTNGAPTGREFRHREVSLPPRHFGFRTSGAPSRWGGGLLLTFTIDGESV